MNKVSRSELLPLAAYEEIRPHFRGRVIQLKARRRTSLGAHMSIVFENHDTMLLQVQEMLRTERISDEAAIAHELATYNELVPAPGQLSATLFLEYEDAKERAQALLRFAGLRTAVQLVIGSEPFQATFATHFAEELDRLPAVNYLTFQVGAERAKQLRDRSVPAKLEVTHPEYRVQVALSDELREELAKDLES
ncbi:MAG TPA: DUF3501 family protein [Polyangiales bacterium]|nr:DUF3501 family protein [Polyangiales bacterium]